MGANSAIEWCDHTMNFWVGCAKVGPGCLNCYAESWAARAGRSGIWGPDAPREKTKPANWREPLKWNGEASFEKPALVFTNSLADFWDNRADPIWREEALFLMERTPNLIWLVLTKRAPNILKLRPRNKLPRNVVLGLTVCNEEELWRDGRTFFAAARELGASATFFSMEPLLGRVPLEPFFQEHQAPSWVIAGGESGPGARPADPDWFRQIRDQCALWRVPFLFKQWGEWAPVPMIMGDNGQLRLRNFAEAARFAGGRAYVPLSSGETLIRAGKKQAGRLLDGQLHNGFPIQFKRAAAAA